MPGSSLASSAHKSASDFDGGYTSQTRTVLSWAADASRRPLPLHDSDSISLRCPRNVRTFLPVATSQTWTSYLSDEASSRPSGEKASTSYPFDCLPLSPQRRITLPVRVSTRTSRSGSFASTPQPAHSTHAAKDPSGETWIVRHASRSVSCMNPPLPPTAPTPRLVLLFSGSMVLANGSAPSAIR